MRKLRNGHCQLDYIHKCESDFMLCILAGFSFLFCLEKLLLVHRMNYTNMPWYSSARTWLLVVLPEQIWEMFFFFFLSPLFFFAEEDLPWANICANLAVFCMRVTTTAWLLISGIGLRPGTKPRPLKRGVPNLTTRPWGWSEKCFSISKMKRSMKNQPK